MTDATPHEALKRIKTQLRLTHLGLWAERASRAFWPLWTLTIAALGLLSLDILDLLPLEAGWFGLISTLLAGLWALVHGLRQFQRPTAQDAIARLDATLPGRPLAALGDTQAIGATDPASQAVWDAHRSRMAARAATARAARPDLRLASRDRYGLRYMALTLFVTALLFGSLWRVTTLSGLTPGASANAATGPTWEGWAQPPTYTGKPTLYLADQVDEALTLPVGTRLSLRLYGEPGALILAETVSGRTDPPPASDPAQDFTLTRSGRLSIQGDGGREWLVTVLPDAPPAIQPAGDMQRKADGRYKQDFTASDDYGVQKGDVVIALDLPSVDRRHGLTLPPEAAAPVTLDLPMPLKRDRRAVAQTLVDDLSKDLLANLPVTMTFSASDAAGQTAHSQPLPITLPGRRFFDPLAAALIEMRRDLMWNRANARRTDQILRAVTHRPEGFFRNQNAYLRLRALITQLDAKSANLDTKSRDEMAEELWQIALMVEEGDLASALERLRRAQDRVDEAIRNGASPEEIDDLMKEMQEALNDYMRQQAEQNGPAEDNPQTSQNGQQGMQMTQDQLNQMLEKLQDLMKQGRTAEAQDLMDQLRDFMENMRVTQGDGQGSGQGSPGDQAMKGLGQTLRDQQQLSDDSFRDLQTGPDGQPQGDDPGDSQGNGESLAERQRDLQRRLDALRGGGDLPGAGDPKGQEGRRELDRAGRAMKDAERALRDGDLPQALDRQAEALDALRNGVRSLGEAQAQNQQEGTQQGQATSKESPDGQRDPLGRETGQSTHMGTDRSMLQGADVYRKAQDLLEEIRRRAGEQDRPAGERGYLKRLLDLF